MKRAIVNINYRNETAFCYDYLELNCDGIRTIFDSGNFVQDWYAMIYYYINKLGADRTILIYSSSVHDFMVDGGSDYYDLFELIVENEQGRLLDNSVDEGIPMYVPKGERLTWEEMKERYKI